jgi:hypothetical protein
MIVGKKKEQTQFLFQNLLQLTLKNILNNALHLVSEGHLNSYMLIKNRNLLIRCVVDLKVGCVLVLRLSLEIETSKSNQNSLELIKQHLCDAYLFIWESNENKWILMSY